MSSSFRDREELERFEERLRSGARELRRAPTPSLGERVLAVVREKTVEERRAERVRPPVRLGLGLAAAAVLVLGAAAWLWSTRARGGKAALRAGPSVVLLSRELLGAPSRMLELPAEAEGNLRAEARNLLLDTTRVAEGLVRGLPQPLRAPLERL